MLKLIANSQVYTRESAGVQSILLSGGKIIKVGQVSGRALASLGVECETVYTSGCVVTPDFIDFHQHLIVAGGEQAMRLTCTMAIRIIAFARRKGCKKALIRQAKPGEIALTN